MADGDGRTRRLAVLIDADNASPRIAGALFREVAAIGEAGVRRAYGDFSGTRLKGWAEILSAHAIVPQHNAANTVGKNATDVALVIDAMDLLHTARLDAFCIVSSDGDFTRLAMRIREQGLDVYGFGERKTPESFRNACKRFAYTEDLLPAEAVFGPDFEKAVAIKPTDAAVPKRPPSTAVAFIRSALEGLSDLGGWFALEVVGHRLAASTPGFDPKAYGCPKLVTLIEKSKAFDVTRDDLRVYIRPKRRDGAPIGAPLPG